MLRFTVDVVDKWMAYWVLNTSMRERSCTFELAAIVIDSNVYNDVSERLRLLQKRASVRKGRFDSYLDDFKLYLSVTILRTAADSLDDCIDQQTRALAICRWRLRSLLILAIIWAITVQEVVAE